MAAFLFSSASVHQTMTPSAQRQDRARRGACNRPRTLTQLPAHNAFVDVLPDELCLEILSWLDAASLCRLGQTCKEMRRLAEEKALWKALCKQTWRRSYWGPKSSAYVALNESLLNEWKRIYVMRTKVNMRWERSDARMVTLYGHHMAVNAVQFDDAKLVSGGEDGLVVVWDIRTGEAARVHQFNDMVAALDYGADGVAVVALWSGEIRVMDLDTGAEAGVLGGHSAGVRALQASDELVVSGDFAGELRVFERNTGVCRAALSAHTAGITALAFSGDMLVTAALDGAIHVYTGLLTANGLPELRARVRCGCAAPPAAMWAVAVSDAWVVAGCESGRIHIWSAANLAPQGTIDAHAARISSLSLDGSRIVSSGDDGLLAVWDAETGRQLSSFDFGPAHPIAAARFDDTKIVTAGGEADPVIRIFDFAYNLDACDARSTIMAMPSARAPFARLPPALSLPASSPTPTSDMVFSDDDNDTSSSAYLLQDMYECADMSDSDSDSDSEMMAIIDGHFSVSAGPR